MTMHGVQYYSTAAEENGSELQSESDKDDYSPQFSSASS